MRRGAPARGLALTAALALALTACSGGEDKEPEETASPSTTAPASQGASSDGADEQPETGGTDESTETTPDDPDDPDDPDEGESPDADDSDPNGEDTGEYVPASADGPAKNVPKPVMPEEMKEETPEGAKAAVQYWWDTVTYLQRTGDSDLVRASSDEDCDFCRAYAHSIEKIYEDGGWTSGSEVEVTSALTGVIDKDRKLLQVTTLLDVEGLTTFKSNGSIDETQSEESYGDSPWITNVKFDEESQRWVATSVSYEGEK
ncbi:hypothetical protein HMPREF2863_05610 [Micrococcus sp. HMSC067E09]|uniref:DUF6318 family protein n=1 Tax=Micrococcus sp. HMSC067E09 TaxID=1739367 RepID=UPI0008A664BA|nr:DUF6318 family protein [Micrococcus sp. HMSC067E09]OFR90967.1 hypothetical protein HMPREF2863_05610 [Micrococcus sp. HMSC067E09]